MTATLAWESMEPGPEREAEWARWLLSDLIRSGASSMLCDAVAKAHGLAYGGRRATVPTLKENRHHLALVGLDD